MLQSTLSVTFLGTILVIFLASGFALQLLRRWIFHPLKFIPGPLANKISEIPAALALVRGNQHLYYKSLHEKYGPVVRVSPNEVSFISVEAREEIYGHRSRGLNMEKSPIFLGAVGAMEGRTGVSLALHEEHARQRRALGYLFTNSALRQFEPIFELHIQKLLSILDETATKRIPVDVSKWYTYLSFDIMGDICFAEPFGCLEQGSATEWSTSVISVFVAATWIQGVRRISGVGTWLESLMTRLLIPSDAAKWRKVHLNNSREKTLRRLEDPDRDHADFLYHILNNESKKSLSRTEIILNMALFISAGTDTTATALTAWTYFVCTHTDTMTRLVTEIRSVLRTNDDIKWEKVRTFRYLEATIHEALRLMPPSPASQQRVVPSGGAEIDGYLMPAGTTVACPPWVSTHSPLNFHEPFEFRPERWLGECDKFSGDRLKASLPFGTGPRVCVGKNLSYMEMQLITAHLLFNFDIELDRGDFVEKNDVWGLDGKLKPFKIFHSMTKPDLYVRMKRVQR